MSILLLSYAPADYPNCVDFSDSFLDYLPRGGRILPRGILMHLKFQNFRLKSEGE